ncbi:MAG TPA: hypothetical protein VF135_01030 [Terriglobales bacterium]
MTKYLWAAYIATWVIHIAYLLYLSARARRIRQEAEDLKRGA